MHLAGKIPTGVGTAIGLSMLMCLCEGAEPPAVESGTIGKDEQRCHSTPKTGKETRAEMPKEVLFDA